MQIDYDTAVSAVLCLLRQQKYSATTIHEHECCYRMFRKHLEAENLPFTMENAIHWNELRKSQVAYETYSVYRKALLRLETYINNGYIDTVFCSSVECFMCSSGMAESLYTVFNELKKETLRNPKKRNTKRYFPVYKEFFRYITVQGVTDISEISIEHIIGFGEQFCQKQKTWNRQQIIISGTTVLLQYLERNFHIPRCYAFVIPKDGIATILAPMKLRFTGRAYHPSKPLEPLAEDCLSNLSKWGYAKSSKKLFNHDFTRYFLFLELNHIEHSAASVELWINTLPDDSVRERRKHTIKLFEDYLKNPDTHSTRAPKHRCIEELPLWSKNILEKFIEERHQEGFSEKTLTMCRSAGCRFFFDLEKNGIRDAENITPESVINFCLNDQHGTPESKNAYGIKLRQLLMFMADNGLVPQTLVYAVPTGCAPRRCIVNTLDDDMVACIYEFRERASTPLELRDVAIVMLGLRMGIRASDIVNLRVENIDWKRRTISFVQKKTGKAITLPMPTDVGNSVYQYIVRGRPASYEDGSGYIFIQHLAPYGRLQTPTVCRLALKRILSFGGYELPAGQGFHITRKTFATRLLEALNKIDDISNALGHVRKETSEVYLERDEAGMRLCPIRFGSVSVC